MKKLTLLATLTATLITTASADGMGGMFRDMMDIPKEVITSSTDAMREVKDSAVDSVKDIKDSVKDKDDDVKKDKTTTISSEKKEVKKEELKKEEAKKANPEKK